MKLIDINVSQQKANKKISPLLIHFLSHSFSNQLPCSHERNQCTQVNRGVRVICLIQTNCLFVVFFSSFILCLYILCCYITLHYPLKNTYHLHTLQHLKLCGCPYDLIPENNKACTRYADRQADTYPELFYIPVSNYDIVLRIEENPQHFWTVILSRPPDIPKQLFVLVMCHIKHHLFVNRL